MTMSKRRTKEATQKTTVESSLKFIGAKVPESDANKLRMWAKELDLTVSQVLRRIVRDRLSVAAGGSEAVNAK